MHDLEKIKREKLRWACRRGMLELDLFLVPFFENKYDTLSATEQAYFEEMLHHTDPELLSWLMGHETPTAENIQTIISKIRDFRLQN